MHILYCTTKHNYVNKSTRNLFSSYTYFFAEPPPVVPRPMTDLKVS